MLMLQSLVGVLLIPLAAWLMSEDRRALTPALLVRVVLAGLLLQFAIAAALFWLPGMRGVFEAVGDAVTALHKATAAGMRMVFGYLAGAPAPFEIRNADHSFILAFQALPLILLLSALSRLLFHWGILQRVVGAFAWLLQRTFRVGGAVGTAAAANVFLGMVEAPLLIRPYLKQIGRGALFATMVAGMATVAGTVMALYALILEKAVPGAAGHVLAASIMNAPAALMLAWLAVPQGFADGPEAARVDIENAPRSSIDAIAQGTLDGISLLASVTAMLVVMVALVALGNSLLGLLGTPFGHAPTLQGMLGVLAAPLAWIIGIPWSEAAAAGALIGQKVVLNELLAYIELAKLPEGTLSSRTRLLLTYALCGFANLGSLGIMIGGYTAMVPERRAEIAELAPKAVLVGLLATLLSAAVVGVLTPG